MTIKIGVQQLLRLTPVYSLETHLISPAKYLKAANTLRGGGGQGGVGKESPWDKKKKGKFLQSLPFALPATSIWDLSHHSLSSLGLTWIHLVPSESPKIVTESLSGCLPLRKPIPKRQELIYRKVVYFQVLTTWEIEDSCHKAHLLKRWGTYNLKPNPTSQWRQRFLEGGRGEQNRDQEKG